MNPTLEDKLNYWLKRLAYGKCNYFEIYLVIEDYYPQITENDIKLLCENFEKEVNDEKFINVHIDWHINNFINNLKKNYIK